MISTVIPCAQAEVAVNATARIARGVATKRGSFLACILPRGALLQRLSRFSNGDLATGFFAFRSANSLSACPRIVINLSENVYRLVRRSKGQGRAVTLQPAILQGFSALALDSDRARLSTGCKV
jgi:hypothetical protein